MNTQQAMGNKIGQDQDQHQYQGIQIDSLSNAPVGINTWPSGALGNGDVIY